MIEFSGRGFTPFLAALMHFRRNGVTVTARGANRGTVPDDTDWALVEQAASIDGVTVWTNLPTPQAQPTAATVPDVPVQPAEPKKRATRRKKES